MCTGWAQEPCKPRRHGPLRHLSGAALLWGTTWSLPLKQECVTSWLGNPVLTAWLRDPSLVPPSQIPVVPSLHCLSSPKTPCPSWPLTLCLSLLFCDPCPPGPSSCCAPTPHSPAPSKRWGSMNWVFIAGHSCLWAQEGTLGGRGALQWGTKQWDALSHSSFFFRSSCCPGACPSPERGVPRKWGDSPASGEPLDLQSFVPSQRCYLME